MELSKMSASAICLPWNKNKWFAQIKAASAAGLSEVASSYSMKQSTLATKKSKRAESFSQNHCLVSFTDERNRHHELFSKDELLCLFLGLECVDSSQQGTSLSVFYVWIFCKSSHHTFEGFWTALMICSLQVAQDSRTMLSEIITL